MTDPYAQNEPTQPYWTTPGQGAEWPTAPLPPVEPPAQQQQWPTLYQQPTPPPQPYGQPYSQPAPAYEAQAGPYGYPQGQQAPYGQPQYPPNIVINNIVQTTAVAGTSGRRKSVGIAFLLTFLFGPLGMFYSTVSGAVVMLLIALVLVPVTAGIGSLLVWPASIIWGCVAASKTNSGVSVNQTSLR